MNSPQSNEVLKAIQRAEHAMENAEYDLAGGYYLAAVNRSYYTCFYCMTALLYTKDTFAKTHQGVRSKFSELFIKTGLFPQTASDAVALLFDYRQEADYNLDADISLEEAKKINQKAAEFLQLTVQYCNSLG